MTEILLTDDELVALSVARSAPWPTALPTLPVGSESALWAAANRGQRSLAVRSLLDVLAPGREGLAAAVDGMLVAERFVGAVITTRDEPGTPVGSGLVFGALGTNLTWTADAFTPNGVHSLDQCDASVVLGRVLEFARRVFELGVGELGTPVAALGVAITSTAEPDTYLFVGKGSVVRARRRVGDDTASPVVIAEMNSLDSGAVAAALGLAEADGPARNTD